MRDKVKEGYEKGAYEEDYREERELQPKEKKFFEELFDQIEGEEVLDLGCGTGIPFDRYLVKQGYTVTGIDIAEDHIEKARANVPEGKFMQGGFFENDFPENSFDAIVSFYAIFHIPREEHSRLLEKMEHWLKEDGAILVTLGAEEEMDNLEGDIGGEEMLWSSYSAEKNRELVEDAGFEIVDSYIEDWRDERHFWILARSE